VKAAGGFFILNRQPKNPAKAKKAPPGKGFRLTPGNGFPPPPA
jgi:hypothetical protein